LARFLILKFEDAVHPDIVNKKTKKKLKPRNFFTKELRMFIPLCMQLSKIKKIGFTTS
jgi:hypothetical protein